MTNEMKRALEFARKYPAWHGFDWRDRQTREIIFKLYLNQKISLSSTAQFKAK